MLIYQKLLIFQTDYGIDGMIKKNGQPGGTFDRKAKARVVEKLKAFTLVSR